jgi:hypothetical protein
MRNSTAVAGTLAAARISEYRPTPCEIGRKSTLPPPHSGDQTESPRAVSLKTGISAALAGDFPEFSGSWSQSRHLETFPGCDQGGQIRTISEKQGNWPACGNAWLGWEDSNLNMAVRNQILFPVQEEAPEPQFIETPKPLETFEFREPYRIRRVQSFREKWAIRRRMSRHCRLEVRSSNEKSLLLPGLIANKFAQRIHGFGHAGGAKGIRTEGTGPTMHCRPNRSPLTVSISGLSTSRAVIMSWRYPAVYPNLPPACLFFRNYR